MNPPADSSPTHDLDVAPTDELAAVRLERWKAQDKAIALEQQLAALQADHALCDGRLRQMSDELLYQIERRRDAERFAEQATRQLQAMRATLWWRLGWLPRWVRSHIR